MGPALCGCREGEVDMAAVMRQMGPLVAHMFGGAPGGAARSQGFAVHSDSGDHGAPGASASVAAAPGDRRRVAMICLLGKQAGK